MTREDQDRSAAASETECEAVQRLALEMARAAYRLGEADGVARGRQLEAGDLDAAWNRIAAAALGPSFDELEGRRWGPGGREHFADPRPGDFPGRHPEREGEAEAG
jgi:hypothetical protein